MVLLAKHSNFMPTNSLPNEIEATSFEFKQQTPYPNLDQEIFLNSKINSTDSLGYVSLHKQVNLNNLL